jgi:hypothetical protein
VVDGNYGPIRDIVWRRPTHLVWLDYERPVIMARVISRTLAHAVLRTKLWAGNREQWRHLLRPSHPIRWAWTTGTAAAAKPRSGWRGRNTRSSWCCGCVAQARYSGQSTSWRRRLASGDDDAAQRR